MVPLIINPIYTLYSGYITIPLAKKTQLSLSFVWLFEGQLLLGSGQTTKKKTSVDGMDGIVAGCFPKSITRSIEKKALCGLPKSG